LFQVQRATYMIREYPGTGPKMELPLLKYCCWRWCRMPARLRLKLSAVVESRAPRLPADRYWPAVRHRANRYGNFLDRFQKNFLHNGRLTNSIDVLWAIKHKWLRSSGHNNQNPFPRFQFTQLPW